jgi:hypothetical protein
VPGAPPDQPPQAWVPPEGAGRQSEPAPAPRPTIPGRRGFGLSDWFVARRFTGVVSPRGDEAGQGEEPEGLQSRSRLLRGTIATWRGELADRVSAVEARAGRSRDEDSPTGDGRGGGVERG